MVGDNGFTMLNVVRVMAGNLFGFHKQIFTPKLDLDTDCTHANKQHPGIQYPGLENIFIFIFFIAAGGETTYSGLLAEQRRVRHC